MPLTNEYNIFPERNDHSRQSFLPVKGFAADSIYGGLTGWSRKGQAGMALSLEERSLITRAVRRDPEAFAELYIQFYDSVFRRVSMIVRNSHDAEDVTSEAFLRAWNAIPRFQDRDVTILAWFCTIAERLAIKHVKARRPNVNVEDVALGAPEEENPDFLFERGVEMAVLKSAIDELPSMQREVVSKRFLEDLSYIELEAATGKSVGAVRVIQHRALKALRTILSAKQGHAVTPAEVVQ